MNWTRRKMRSVLLVFVIHVKKMWKSKWCLQKWSEKVLHFELGKKTQWNISSISHQINWLKCITLIQSVCTILLFLLLYTKKKKKKKMQRIMYNNKKNGRIYKRPMYTEKYGSTRNTKNSTQNYGITISTDWNIENLHSNYFLARHCV